MDKALLRQICLQVCNIIRCMFLRRWRCLAYAVHYGLKSVGEVITIQQGRFVERPSEIYVQVETSMNVLVSGGVKIIARGQFF